MRGWTTTTTREAIKMNVFILMSILSLTASYPTDGPLFLRKKQAIDCPLYLPANKYEFPHLIVPISTTSPNAVFGNSYTPSVSPNDLATIFNFDIPASRAGQQCSLYFSFPTQSQLVTTAFSYSGPGTFEFALYRYNSGAARDTTWNGQPPLDQDSASWITGVAPGHVYKIWEGDCGQGGMMSWRMSSPDSCFWYFQDFNDCAIGAYILYG